MKHFLAILICLFFFASMADAQDLYPYKKRNGKWGYKTEKGKKIVKAKYEMASSFSSGHGIVKKDFQYAFINRKGIIVSQWFYYLEKSQGGWYLCQEKEGYNFVRPNGHKMLANDLEIIWPSMHGFSMVWNKGQYAFIDTLGQQINNTWYKDAWHFDTLMLVMEDNSLKRIYSDGNTKDFEIPLDLRLAKQEEPTYKPSDTLDPDQVFIFVENMPEYPGGDMQRLKFMAQQIRYPVWAMMEGYSAKVHVQFVVEKDGLLSNVKILKSGGLGMDQEIHRVVKMMPLWAPGYIGKNPVRVQFTMPVNFQLQ